MPRIKRAAKGPRWVLFHSSWSTLIVDLDVWKEIVVVTQPDMRTGRRGENISVCKPLRSLLLIQIVMDS